MQRVNQSVDQVFGRLKVRANRHGDHLLYSPVRTFSSVLYQGRDMAVPKPLPRPAAVTSLCVRSEPGHTSLELPAIEQTSGLTACATNPVGIWC